MHALPAREQLAPERHEMTTRDNHFKDYLGPVYPRAVERLQAAFDSVTPLAQTSMLSGIRRGLYTIEIVFLPLSFEGVLVDRIMMCIGLLSRPKEQ
jgi:hypothetical protein